MKNELYFLRFGFVKKMIARKHIGLVKESIESVCMNEDDENLKVEMIQGLEKSFLKSDDEIIREWIDFYVENKDGVLLRRILQNLHGHTPSKKINSKPFSGLRFLVQYLQW